MGQIRESTLITPRTAQIYQLGEFTEVTRSIWILLHGYAQSARHFLIKFDEWNNDETVLIAPEGLSRFYLKGFDGRVGASWMTKENRENEIRDQLSYLDNLTGKFALNENIKLNLFGFSQGAAVACRWYQHTPVKVSNLIIWGAGLPIETTVDMALKYNQTNCIFMLGDNDEFIKPEMLQDHFSRLDLLNFNHQRIIYEGGHSIEKNALKLLKKRLSEDAIY